MARILPPFTLCLLFTWGNMPSVVGAAEPTEVSYAAGAISFTYEDDLRASELPRGRQVLLVLSRHEPPQGLAKLYDGFWVSYVPGPPPTLDDLSRTLRNGLSRDLRRVRLGRSIPVELAGRQGIRQEFTVANHGALFAAPKGPAAAPDRTLKGWRQLIRSETGIVELHFIAPADEFEARQRRLEAILSTLALQAPSPSANEAAPDLLDAEKALGRWKSPRGLMEISGDGRIVLTYDRERNYELDRLGLVDYKKPLKRLEGTYRAEGDLIRIRWADGSLLNMRWRRAGEELLVTDHQGRTRRLARVYR